MKFKQGFKLHFLSKIKSSRFSNIELEIFHGNFAKANELLEEFDNSTNKSPDDIIKGSILKCYVVTSLGNPAGGLELVEKIIIGNSSVVKGILLGEIYVCKAYSFFELNKIVECNENLEKANDVISNIKNITSDSTKEIQAKIHYLRGKLLRKKNDIPNSLAELNKSLVLRKDSNNLDGLGDVYAELGILYYMSNEGEKSVEYLLNGIEIFEKLNSKTKLLKAYNNIGLIYSNLVQQDKGIKYYLLSSKLLEEFGEPFKRQLGVVNHNIGTYYYDKGEIDIALNYIERAKRVFEDLGAKEQMGYSLNLEANIYDAKGEVQKSLSLYTDTLKIFNELNNVNEIATAYNNLGNIYSILGENDRAKSYFEKSLEYNRTIRDPRQTPVTLSNLVEIYAATGNIDKASEYLEELYELNKTGNKLTDQLYRLAKASILKKSKRILKRAEAQLIYQQIANDEVLSHQNTVLSLFNLCEMLIQELRTSGNEAILQEIKNVIFELIKVAENQNSYKVLVQSKLLQSKVSLLEMDLETAKLTLSDAQKIAFEKGIDNLAMVISGEYETLIKQLDKWKALIDSNVTLIERIEMAELEDLVSNMVRKKLDTSEILAEDPELFLVLNENGVKIFSKIFVSGPTVDDQVIGDLLTAVNSFIQETFSTSGSIERLKHKEHTFLLKPFEKYLLCYIFKGPSYSAQQKLEQFIEQIQQTQPLSFNEKFNSLVSSTFIAETS